MKKLLFILLGAILMISCEKKNEEVATNIEETFYVTKNDTLPGIFSIDDIRQVQFSKGNLQFYASTKTWRFAEFQHNILAESNKNIAETFNGWIDLFGWGTGNNPTLSSTNDEDYLTFTEWLAKITSDGSDQSSHWRTLTSTEWLYLFRNRTNADSLFGLGVVVGLKGIILLPDEWSIPDGLTFYSSVEQKWQWRNGPTATNCGYYKENGVSDTYNLNNYSFIEWQRMDTAGAVFLPAAGYREGTELYNIGECGYYWASTPYGIDDARNVYFGLHGLGPVYSDYRHCGLSVRLVCEICE